MSYYTLTLILKTSTEVAIRELFRKLDELDYKKNIWTPSVYKRTNLTNWLEDTLIPRMLQPSRRGEYGCLIYLHPKRVGFNSLDSLSEGAHFFNFEERHIPEVLELLDLTDSLSMNLALIRKEINEN